MPTKISNLFEVYNFNVNERHSQHIMYMYALLVILMYWLHLNICQEEAQFRMNGEVRNQLDQAERRAICCAKHMRCCNETGDDATPPSIELRAILVRCPNSQCDESVVSRSTKKHISSSRVRDIKEFQGFDEDEPLTQSEVVNCHKKLLITMKIKNSGTTNLHSEFVVVDHVYDPISEKRARLLNPYVIKIKQQPITQMYKLRFQYVVNSEAREVVYTKHDGNYTGCDTTSSRPTCGTVKYKGKPIPYSTGFCCSCDALKNAERQPSSSSASEPIISYSDPSFLLDGVECPKNLKGPESSPSPAHYIAGALSTSKNESSVNKTDKLEGLVSTPSVSVKNRAREDFENLLGITPKYKLNTFNDVHLSKVLKDVSNLKSSLPENSAIRNILDDKPLKLHKANSNNLNRHKIFKRGNMEDEEEDNEEVGDKIKYIAGKSSKAIEDKIDSLKDMLSHEMKSDTSNGDMIRGI